MKPGFFIFLALINIALATHFRFCTIRSHPRILSNSDPVTWKVTLTIEGAYRANYQNWDRNGGPALVGDLAQLDNVLNWGDQTTETILLNVTVVNVVDNWLYGVYDTNHDFPEPGVGQTVLYEPQHTACCRIIPLINVPGQSNLGGGYYWRYSVRVICAKDSSGRSSPSDYSRAASPVTAMLPIVQVPIDTNATYDVPASWVGQLYWRLADGIEMGASTSPLPVQVQPGYDRNINPNWVFGFAPLNTPGSRNTSGTIIFLTYQPRIRFGLYCTQHIISTEPVNPTLERPYISRNALFTTVDYIINVTAKSDGSPCVATSAMKNAFPDSTQDTTPSSLTPNAGAIIEIEPNKPMSPINLIGYDNKAPNDPTRAVSLLVGGLPSGATTTTASGVNANYVGPAATFAGFIPDSRYLNPLGFRFFGNQARYLILNWTPTTSQIGTWFICIQVTDAYGGKQLCSGGNQHCFALRVAINPCFNGGVLQVVPGSGATLQQCQTLFDPTKCICDCTTDQVGCGQFSGQRCAECIPGNYGPDCCPCPSCVPNQGSCNSGAVGNGQCVCRPGWTGADCNTSSSQRCVPTAPAFVSNQVNSTNSLINPAQATVFLSSTANTPGTTFNFPLETNVVPIASRSTDIIFLQDLSGQGGSSNTGTTGTQTGGTLNNMIVNAAGFINNLATLTTAPFIGVASFDGNTANSYRFVSPLTIDAPTFSNNYARMIPTSTNSPDSGTVPLDAAQSAIVDPGFSFRPNSAKFIVIFVNKPIVASAARITSFRNALISVNVVPIFATVSSSTQTSLQSIVTSITFGTTILLQAAQANWFTIVTNAVTSQMTRPSYQALTNPWIQTVPPSPPCSSTTCVNNRLTSLWTLVWPGSGTFSGTATLTVMGFGQVQLSLLTNSPPVAVASTLTGTEDTPLQYTLGASDPNNNILSITFVSIPPSSQGILFHPRIGGVNITSAGQVSNLSPGSNILQGTFYPSPNWCGTTSFTYKAFDGCLESNTAQVTINIQCINDPPTCTSGNCNLYSTNQNVRLPIDFTSIINDIETPSNLLSVRIDSIPNLGTLIIGTSGATITAGQVIPSNGKQITFIPTNNINGTTSFSYSVIDNSSPAATSSSCTINICIAHVNQCPSISVLPAILTARIGVQTSFRVTVTDPDNPDNYRVSLVSSTVPFAGTQASNGVDTTSFGLSAGNDFSGTPPIDIVQSRTTNGASDSFNIIYTAGPTATGIQGTVTLQAFDTAGLSCGPVTVSIIAGNNTPPYIIPQVTLVTPEDTCINNTVFTNSSDPDLPHQTRLSQFYNTLPQNGILIQTRNSTPIDLVTIVNPTTSNQNQFSNGTFYTWTYCPNPNFYGQDCYTYTVVDLLGAQSLPNTDCINVTFVNDPPTTQNVTVTIKEDECADIIIPGYDVDILPVGPDVNNLTLTIISEIRRRGGIISQIGNLTYVSGSTQASNGVTYNRDNTASGSFFTFRYCPPLYQHSDNGTCFAEFDYIVTDPQGAQSTHSTACVIIVNINHPPTCLGDKELVAIANQPLQIKLEGNDVDSEDIGHLVGVINTIISTSRGTLKSSNNTNNAVDLKENSTTGNDMILYYWPALNDCNRPDDPNPIMIFYYQVRDPLGFLSTTCKISITITCVNLAPTCPNISCYIAQEDIPSYIVLPIVDDFFNDPTKTGTIISFINPSNNTYWPSRGNISTIRCELSLGCFTDHSISADQINSNYPSGYAITGNQVSFIALPNDNSGTDFSSTCDYTSFCVRYTDNGGLFVDCCFNITVEPINDPPEIIPIYPTTNNVGEVTICENSYAVLDFNVTDIDSPIDVLTAKISLFPSPVGISAGSKIYYCTSRINISNHQEIVSDCIKDSHIVNATNPFIPRVSPGQFRVLFVPAQDAHAGNDIFTTIQFTAYDDHTDPTNQSAPATVQLKVRPVNSPPEIISPGFIRANAGQPIRISPVFVNDSDVIGAQRSNGAIKYIMTINVTDGYGELNFTNDIYQSAFTPNFQNQTSCQFVFQNTSHSPYYILCYEVLDKLELFANNTVFTPINSTLIDHLEHHVTFFINDTGYLGGASCDFLDIILPLTAINITIIYIDNPIIIVPTNKSVLTGIIAGVAAAVLLALLVLALFIKSALGAVPEGYFNAFADPSAGAVDSPIYAPNPNSGNNPLFENL